MKHIVLFLVATEVILLFLFPLSPGSTSAYPVSQVTPTPTAFNYYLPFVAKNWLPIPPEWRRPPEGEIFFQSTMSEWDELNFPPIGYARMGADFELGSNFPVFGSGGEKAFAVGEPVFVPRFNDYRRKGCRSCQLPTIYGPHSLAMTIMVGTDIDPLPEVMAHNSRWVSPLGVWGERPGEQYAAVATAVVGIEPRGNSQFGLVLYTPDLDGEIRGPQNKGVILPNAPLFEFGRKYRVEVAVLSDRHVLLYQTDISAQGEPQLVSFGSLGRDHQLALIGGHGGVYTGPVNTITTYNSDLVMKKLGPNE